MIKLIQQEIWRLCAPNYTASNYIMQKLKNIKREKGNSTVNRNNFKIPYREGRGKKT